MYRAWAGHDPEIQPYLEYYGLPTTPVAATTPAPAPVAAPAPVPAPAEQPRKGERGR
jgi:peptidyl-dipeptidase Dcp